MPIGPTRSSSARSSATANTNPSAAPAAGKTAGASLAYLSTDTGWRLSWPLVLCAFGYALVLIALIGKSSLWADEAYSAWQASHVSLRSFAASLFAGDSSDLQMGLYYVYLFGWVKLFGMSEYALRAANIPFIVLFSFALVWTSRRILKSPAAWLVAAMLPFIWRYATDARAYMAMLAFSTAAFACVLGFIRAERVSAAKKYPWLLLACVFVGSLFHMLFLLAVPALLLLLGWAYWTDRSNPRWRLWKGPLIWFAAPMAGLAAYFSFTFSREFIGYSYPRPGLRQMASVLYELAGFGNFGPNRKFSIDFSGYTIPLVLGGAILMIGVAVAVWLVASSRSDQTARVLCLAVFVSGAEVGALSWTMGKQFDARHLAALVPLLLFLLPAVSAVSRKRMMTAAMILIGGAWFAADLRGLVLPDYHDEDYRGAVRALQTLHQQTGGEILLASDPVAPAYYGLDVRGPAPCFPIVFDCEQAFRKVPWPHGTPAWSAALWSEDQIRSRLAASRGRGKPVIILHELIRSRRNWPWWPILAQYSSARRIRIQGLEIIVLN